MTGRTLAHYHVLEKLGAGGMGEVYRARDTKLGRDVAIKVLPEAFARDPERLKRFEREARVLASLNHPNIAAIYGFEQADGVHFLVLEYVPGQILAGPLEIDEALRVAGQIADALEEAHEKGFVHRDLKPANIKVTPEGKVKVLDFGLAKALADEAASADPSASPTVSIGPTRAGVILGTAAYMSPEQARGRPLDKRTDIWAFGCVLYEVLAGRQAFGGESIPDTLSAVLKAEPDWSGLPAETPPSIQRLLRRCLRKDPRERLRDIGDARFEMRPEPAAPPPALPKPRPRLLWAIAAVPALAAAFAAGLWWRGARPAAAPSWTGDLLGGPAAAMGPRVSPDGQTLAFQALVDGLTQVAVMKPETGNWTVLTRDRTRGAVTEICWSRDGARLYFDRFVDVPRGIFHVPVLGGEERLVLEDAFAPQVLPDGSLLVLRVNPERQYHLFRFWQETARLQDLAATVPLASPFVAQVRVFPDGREAAFFGKPREAPAGSPEHLYAIDLASGRSRRLAPGAPMVLSMPGAFPVAVPPDGRSVLINLPSGNLQRIVAVPRDGSGGVRTLLTLTQEPYFLDVGPDGSLYLDQFDRPGEVLRFSASGGAPERIAVSVGAESTVGLPLPDGRVLLSSRAGRDRLLVAVPDRDPVPLVDTQEETALPAAMIGVREVAFLMGAASNRTIAVASLADGRLIRRLKGVRDVRIQGLAASPDGKNIYYVASGAVWAIPAADGEPRKIRAGDAVAPHPNGQELILKLNEKDGIRLVRLPLSGGAESEIPVRGPLRLTPVPLAPNAVAEDGRILVQVSGTDSWFWRAAVLDPKTGSVAPLAYHGDVFVAGWTHDGRIAAFGVAVAARLWRFRPEGAEKR